MNTNQMINNYTKEVQKMMDDALKTTKPSLGINIEPFTKGLDQTRQQIMEEINSTLKSNAYFVDQQLASYNKIILDNIRQQISLEDVAKDAVAQIKKSIDSIIESQCENIKILGKYGWAICSMSFIREFSFWTETSLNFPKELKKMEESKEVEIGDIDDYITESLMKQLSKEKKEEIKDKFTKRTNDKKKIDNLFDDFKNEKYYECANVLFGLIDSEIIKFNLDDCENGKYNISKNEEKGKYESANGQKLCNGTTGEPKIGQGWEALSILFKNNLKSFFNSKDFNPHKGEDADEDGIKRIWTKEELFDKFVNKVKLEMDRNVGFEFFNIAYPLLIFFNDNDWKEEKPKIINRNWLMHGMCKYDDITRNDCIKLFLLYYQFICFLEADWAATIECSETKSTTS